MSQLKFHVAQFFLSIALVVLLTTPSQAVDFKQLPIDYDVSNSTVSEDGKYLVLLHETDGAISILDSVTQEVLKEIEAPAPTVAIVRGDELIVANRGEGTLNVYSIKRKWTLINEVKIGRPNPVYMSAPGGKYYTGFVVVSCRGDARYHMPMMLVNVRKDRHVELSNGRSSYASVDYAGRNYFAQGGGGSPSHAIGHILDFKPLTAGKKTGSGAQGRDSMPLVFQVSKGSYWFGGTQIAKGMPPKLIGERLGNLLVPDRQASACYGIEKDSITCYRLAAGVPKVGTHEITFPKTYARFHGKNWRGLSGGEYKHVVQTLNGKLYCYLWDSNLKVVYYAVMDAFPVTSKSARTTRVAPQPDLGKPSDSAPDAAVPDIAAPIAEGDGLPPKIEAAKPLKYHLYGSVQNGDYEVVSGPKGLKVSKTGLLSWTPTKEQAGNHKFKIRASVAGKVSFLRLETEVFDLTDVPKTARIDPENPNELRELDRIGIQSLNIDRAFLSYTHDKKSILLLDGADLYVLDSTGMAVQKKHELEGSYRQIYSRAEYFVALGNTTVDLIDRKNFKVLRSIPLRFSGVQMLVIDPLRKRSFVTFKNSSKSKPIAKRHPVAVIDETRGTVAQLPNTYGLKLAIDSTGKRLVTSSTEIYKTGITIDLRFASGVREEFDSRGVVQAYDISQASPKMVSSNPDPGDPGVCLVVAPSDGEFTYVSGKGVVAFSTAEVNRRTGHYDTIGYPIDMDYHHSVDIVACASGEMIAIYDRRRGVRLEGRVDPDRKWKEVRQVLFSPSGKNLIVVHNHPRFGRVAEAVSLKLTSSELAQLGRANSQPSKQTTDDKPKTLPVRTWSDRTGSFKVRAKYISHDGDSVRLQKEDGRIIIVPISRLHARDQQELKNLR